MLRTALAVRRLGRPTLASSASPLVRSNPPSPSSPSPSGGASPPVLRRSFTSSSSRQQQQQQSTRHCSSHPRDAGLAWTSVVSDPPEDTPGPEGIPGRPEQIRRLRGLTDDATDRWDVLVIGGGATGAGIALDAATRQQRVACIERGDFASETSSRSTKLIWAGLKYLGTASSALLSWNLLTHPRQTINDFVEELRMVLHCHQERRYMTEQQRHLTNWIPIVVPFDSWYVSPPPMGHPLFGFIPFLAPLLFKFYDALSGFSCPPSYILSSSTAKRVFPQLGVDDRHIHYCAVFYEAQHNDARTNIAMAMTAAQHGAAMCNYVEAIGLVKDASTQRVIGATVMDRMTGACWNVYADRVVLAGGPFTDGLRHMEATEQTEAVQGASGTHIVLPGHVMPKDLGLLDMNTSDGRFLFMLPWQGHTLVGTTDQKNKAETLPTAPEEEILWLLNECQKYLRSDLKIQRSDVLSAWRGWRPLAVDPNAPPDAPASRDHIISENPETGVIFIAGGKWTTWRLMAEEVMDRIVGTNGPKCRTLTVKLHGGEGFSDDLPKELVQTYGLEDDIAEHLVRTYGARAKEVCELGTGQGKHSTLQRLVDGFPYIEAEVVFACREYACTIEDVLSRRTRLAFLNKQAAVAAIPRVAEIMSRELGWKAKVKEMQIAAATGYMESYGGQTAVPVTHGLSPEFAVDSPETLFTALEIDTNGSIGKEDLTQAVQRLGLQLSEQEIEVALADMERIGQGRVTVAAFQKWWQEQSSSEFRQSLSKLRSQATRH